MRAKDIIRARHKTNIDLGEWKTGHITRRYFPLSKARNRNYKYGPAYRWRVIRFEADGRPCRVLILYNHCKSIFRAALGVEVPDDTRVLCMHEFHQDEPGWHCHVRLEDDSDVEPGLFRGGMRRRPLGDTIPERMTVGLRGEEDALRAALKFYRIEKTGDLL